MKLRRLVRVPRRYAGKGILGFLKVVLALFALGGLILGPADWVHEQTSPGVIVVDVEVPQRVGQSSPPLQDPSLQVGALREGVTVFVAHPAPATLSVQNPGRAAKLLWHSGTAVGGVALGLGALAMLGVLSDIGRGMPFSRRNTRRLALIALLIAVAGAGSQLLDRAATHAAVSTAGLVGSPLEAPVVNLLPPLYAALGVLALAEAFRVGARLSQDVEGLV